VQNDEARTGEVPGGLAGTGSSQLSLSAAMRARDVSPPGPEHLAAARRKRPGDGERPGDGVRRGAPGQGSGGSSRERS
jgi:hypothetical protein